MDILYIKNHLFSAVWVPEDAVVNPKKVSEVLAYLAYQGGARFVGSCGAKRILVNKVKSSCDPFVLQSKNPIQNLSLFKQETSIDIL